MNGEVLNERGVLSTASVGPFAAWVAAVLESEGGTSSLLSIVSVDDRQLGSNVIDLAAPGGSYPRWHPSGKAVLFRSRADGFECLWAVRLNLRSMEPKGEPFAFHHFHDRQFPMDGNYWVARDRVFVGIHETRGNIWILDPARSAE